MRPPSVVLNAAVLDDHLRLSQAVEDLVMAQSRHALVHGKCLLSGDSGHRSEGYLGRLLTQRGPRAGLLLIAIAAGHVTGFGEGLTKF